MSSNEEKKSEHPATVRAFLKEARARKKMSVDELAAAASISSRDLERLEAGDYGQLPADIYVKSFLERCAGELDIKEDYLLDLYRKETLNHKNKKEARAPAASRRKSFTITPKLLIMTASAIGVVLLVIYFWYQLSGLLAPPFLFVDSPGNDIITSEETISISGRTSKDSHIFINEREVEVNGDGSFSDDFHMELGINVVEIKSVNRFGKETVLIRRIIKQ